MKTMYFVAYNKTSYLIGKIVNNLKYRKQATENQLPFLEQNSNISSIFICILEERV